MTDLTDLTSSHRSVDHLNEDAFENKVSQKALDLATSFAPNLELDEEFLRSYQSFVGYSVESRVPWRSPANFGIHTARWFPALWSHLVVKLGILGTIIFIIALAISLLQERRAAQIAINSQPEPPSNQRAARSFDQSAVPVPSIAAPERMVDFSPSTEWATPISPVSKPQAASPQMQSLETGTRSVMNTTSPNAASSSAMSKMQTTPIIGSSAAKATQTTPIIGSSAAKTQKLQKVERVGSGTKNFPASTTVKSPSKSAPAQIDTSSIDVEKSEKKISAAVSASSTSVEEPVQTDQFSIQPTAQRSEYFEQSFAPVRARSLNLKAAPTVLPESDVENPNASEGKVKNPNIGNSSISRSSIGSSNVGSSIVSSNNVVNSNVGSSNVRSQSVTPSRPVQLVQAISVRTAQSPGVPALSSATSDLYPSQGVSSPTTQLRNTNSPNSQTNLSPSSPEYFGNQKILQQNRAVPYPEFSQPRSNQ